MILLRLELLFGKATFAHPLGGGSLPFPGANQKQNSRVVWPGILCNVIGGE